MRSIGCVVVSVGLLSALSRPVGAFEYLGGTGLTANKFLLADGVVRTAEGPKVKAEVGQVPADQGFRADPRIVPQEWILSAELRDANCPRCQFPAAQFSPEGVHCFRIPCGDQGATWAIATKFAGAFISGIPFLQTENLHLEQDTRSPEIACSQEDNLFAYQETHLQGDQNPPLADLGGLLVRFYHQVFMVEQGEGCPAGLSLGSTLAGIKFINAAGQVLNYQLVTFDSRGEEFEGLWWSFIAANGETVYGVNDSVGVYKMDPIVPKNLGKPFSVEVLGRFRGLLATNPLGLDADPAHWRVAGMYSGSTTNGHAFIQSSHTLLSLEG
ncbi:MAG TPA: hypothetical protein VGX03_12170, partial [Candidatus Binatia bacterium]|nr:hypothetical protein [Candidatus Binatia bacterium]